MEVNSAKNMLYQTLSTLAILIIFIAVFHLFM